ncbi:MAG TPA: hypothetical protein VFZ00_28425 [Solirubrobacter sp.]|nr:hypothetical protein [Solirubrobacter sp.]
MTVRKGSLTLAAPSALATRLLRGLFGPTLPRAKTADEAAWEDDGGALAPDAEGYEWTIGPAA